MRTSNPAAFAKWTRALRAEFDLRQVDLASLAGLGLNTVANIEQARVTRHATRDAVRKVAKKLRQAAANGNTKQQ